MTYSYLMTTKELALLLRTSAQNINNQISRGLEGEELPPSLRLGTKRLWRSETVFSWLEGKEAQNKPYLHSTGKAQALEIRRL